MRLAAHGLDLDGIERRLTLRDGRVGLRLRRLNYLGSGLRLDNFNLNNGGSIIVIGLEEGLVVDVGAIFECVEVLDQGIAAVNLLNLVLDLLLHESLDRRFVRRSTKLLHRACLDLLLVNFISGLGAFRVSACLGKLAIDDAQLLYLLEGAVDS